MNLAPETLRDRGIVDWNLPRSPMAQNFLKEFSRTYLYGNNPLDIKKHANPFTKKNFHGWPSEVILGKVLGRLCEDNQDWKTFWLDKVFT